MQRIVLLVACAIAACAPLARAQASRPAAPPATREALMTDPATRPAGPERLLANRPMTEAVDALLARVGTRPQDDATVFALGIAQTLRAIEGLAEGLHTLGPRSDGLAEEFPFLRLPVPPNDKSKAVTADDVDAVLARFVDDLAVARKTLEGVNDPNVKLPLLVPMMQLDLNGAAPDGETPVWVLLAKMGLLADMKVDDAADLYVGLDLGDAHWLRGYTHLLSALAEGALAYDKSRLIDRTGHLFFQKIKNAPPELADAAPMMQIMESVDIVDVIAFIHELRLPVKDPRRLQSAHGHLLATIACSRASWAAILKETDNDHEWVPGPTQASVMPRLVVTQEVVDGWLAFLDEGEAVLNGKMLIPFWRNDQYGVNVRRVFGQPPELDVVMWLQGTAVVPYLEQGKNATGDTVRRMEQLLQGDFFRFAVIVN